MLSLYTYTGSKKPNYEKEIKTAFQSRAQVLGG